MQECELGKNTAQALETLSLESRNKCVGLGIKHNSSFGTYVVQKAGIYQRGQEIVLEPNTASPGADSSRRMKSILVGTGIRKWG